MNTTDLNICPYCNNPMEKGSLDGGIRQILTWVSEKKKERSILGIHKTIKLASFSEGNIVTIYHCDVCKKFIIHEET